MLWPFPGVGSHTLCGIRSNGEVPTFRDRLRAACVGWRAGIVTPVRAAHRRVRPRPARADPYRTTRARRLRTEIWLLRSPPAATQPAGASPARDGTGALLDDLAPVIVGAVPLLVPLLALAAMGDPAILQVLLWRGSLPALFAAMLIGLLPLVVGSIVFLAVRRVAGRRRFRVAAVNALLAATTAMPFTPIIMAVAQLTLLAALFAALWPRRGPGRRIAWRLVAAVGALLITFTAGYHSWPGAGTPAAVPKAATSRVLYALPREVVIDDSNARAYYVVAVDESFTTVITGYPAEVRSIRNDTIDARVPCRHREQGGERTLASFLKSDVRATGTPYCEPLVGCLGTVPSAPQRYSTAVLESCIRQARA